MTVAIRQPDAETPFDVCYRVTGLAPAIALSDADDNLDFIKELIYEGNFKKDLGEGEDPLEFSVDSPLLSHWKKTGDDMLAAGVMVPLPTHHTEESEANRGEIKQFILSRNSRGLNSLYAHVRFRDKEAAKNAKSSDVSIYVPKEAKDGLGKVYPFPVRHVALTTYPVIPGLEKFKAIAASLVTGTGDSIVNAIQTLATALGLSIDGVSDDDLVGKIKEMFTSLKGKADGGTTPPPGEKIPDGMAASFTRLLKENREAKLDALVRGDGKVSFITKAARDELAKQHCAPEALALSLSLSSDGADKAFDSLCEALKKNIAVTLGERTGAQGVALSNPGLLDPKTNPLIAGAEALAAAAK